MASRIPPRLARLSRAGWPRSFPVAQFPNPPLVVALIAGLLRMVTDGHAHRLFSALFYLGLAIWAWEEASRGVNWFRRLLGVGGLVFVVVRLVGSLER